MKENQGQREKSDYIKLGKKLFAKDPEDLYDYDYENNVKDFNELVDLMRAEVEARKTVFKLVEKVSELERDALLADLKYRKKRLSTLNSIKNGDSTGRKTVSQIEAEADLACFDEYAQVQVYKQAISELNRLLAALREELRSFANQSSNIRHMQKVI